MARRYRYAFAKKKEAQKGKLSTGLAIASLILFAAAVLLDFFLKGNLGYIVGGISLFAMLLSIYGFAMGLLSFSEENRTHRTSMVGSIANGIIMIGWLGIFLMGISGYNGAAAAQTESANMMIIMLYSVVPALFCLAQYILLKLYDLDKYLPQIREDLAAKHAE